MSSSASLCRRHRGFSVTPTAPSPTGSYFQLIEELALCLPAHRKSSQLADMLCLHKPGFPSVHGQTCFSNHTEEPVFLWPLLLSFTLNPLQGLEMAHAGPWPGLPPPPPPLTHQRFIKLVTWTFHGLVEGHSLPFTVSQGRGISVGNRRAMAWERETER